MSPDLLIEGVLFFKAAPLKKAQVAKLCGIAPDLLPAAIVTLQERLALGATRLIETTDELQLMTAPELGTFIETLRKDELKGDIGKAGIETLAIVLYKEPVSRAEIDRIRGVNSSFSLRALLVRGLISRQTVSGGSHTFCSTPALLATLGVAHKHDLPNFSVIMNGLETFEASEAAVIAEPA